MCGHALRATIAMSVLQLAQLAPSALPAAHSIVVDCVSIVGASHEGIVLRFCRGSCWPGGSTAKKLVATSGMCVVAGM